MDGLLLGFALGAMAFTKKGREIGNQIGAAAVVAARKVMENGNADQSSEQSSGAVGNHRSDS